MTEHSHNKNAFDAMGRCFALGDRAGAFRLFEMALELAEEQGINRGLKEVGQILAKPAAPE